jgi:hypothetical protein
MLYTFPDSHTGLELFERMKKIYDNFQAGKDTKVVATTANTESVTSTRPLRNEAFVFIKPHANTPAVQQLVEYVT